MHAFCHRKDSLLSLSFEQNQSTFTITVVFVSSLVFRILKGVRVISYLDGSFTPLII